MDEADRPRMADLLRKNRRLLPGIVQKWASRGVSASPLSDERQLELLTKLRAWGGSAYCPVTDLRGVILEFLDDLSVVTVIDFDANEEPALPLPARSLAVSEKVLREVYPDGFVLIREDAALIIDFEEWMGRVNVSYAPAR